MQDVRCHARTPRQPCAATPEIVIIAMLGHELSTSTATRTQKWVLVPGARAQHRSDVPPALKCD